MNCTADNVRTIIHTSLTDTEIEAVIAMSDAEIFKMAGSRITGEVARKLSALISASTIKTRQPSSTAIGEYSEESGDVQEIWVQEIEKLYGLYRHPSITTSEYQSIDEETRYGEGI